INSDQMLWSMAGNLAMVYRVFFGMSFEADRLVFDPYVPQAYTGTKQVNGFKYRDAILDIEVKGFGNAIARFTLDGQEVEQPEIPGELSGRHRIVIELN